MRAVVQRVSEAGCTSTVRCGPPLDGDAGAARHRDRGHGGGTGWLCGKLVRLRIFPNDERVMDLDVMQAGGDVLLVSQFTRMPARGKATAPVTSARPVPRRPSRLYLRAKQRLTELLGRPGP